MTRLKIGVLGCGAIAQVQHLPHLRELDGRFEIAGLCDLSRRLLDAVGDEYHLPAQRRFTDFAAMLAADVQAVIICHSGRHDTAAIEAARAGKHAFVEKPMCTTEAQARAMVAAADEAGVVLQVGYMKRHDPAYQYVQARVADMKDIRFVQVNHLHCENSLHLREFKMTRFEEPPPANREAAQVERRRAVAELLGLSDPDQLTPAVQRAFSAVLGSMIHDLGNLEGLFGPPSRVVSTEVWADGRALSTVLEYPNEVRAVASWVDLPELWEFTETLEVYGSRERVRASFPTGFSRGLPSTVAVHGMEADGLPWRKELSWHENPFKLELQHFRTCILEKKEPITPGRRAAADIALVRDIIRAYLGAQWS